MPSQSVGVIGQGRLKTGGKDPAGIRETVSWERIVILAFDPVDAGPLKNARLLEPLGFKLLH